MSQTENPERSADSLRTRPMRLWPGVIIVALQLLIRFAYPAIVPEGMMIAVMGGMACTIAIIILWIFFSRAQRIERFGAIILIIASLYGISFHGR